MSPRCINVSMGLITCPNCGKQISDRASKCIYCGCLSTEFNAPKMISCPECGESIDPTNKKCPNCGFPIEKVNKVQEENNRNSTIIIHGYKECYAIYPVISIYKDEEYIGDIGYDGFSMVSISSDCDIIFKCDSVSKTVHVRKGIDNHLYLSYHNYPAEINVTKSENEITNEVEELFCTNCGTAVTGKETFCPNCGCQFVCDQVDNSFSDTHWNWRRNWHWYRIFQILVGFYGLMFAILNLTGATGDRHDFARKYAQKYGYNYSDINRELNVEPNYFPLPHSTFYFRLQDGSKKVVGSCAFWVYTFKDSDSSNTNEVELTTPERDAKKCNDLIDNSNTLKELNEAKRIVLQYYDAYKNALYEGNISREKWETFLKGLGGLDAHIENKAIDIVENQK